MKKKKVAINGFGRIGRLCFRNLLKNQEIEIVAINDLADAITLVHLLGHDSVHGKLDPLPILNDNAIKIGDNNTIVFNEKDPGQLPWADLEIDIVIESSGQFTTYDAASRHLSAGAKKVIISAPAKGDIKTVVLGVNESGLQEDDLIVSNASCTTNCIAPMAKVIDEHFEIEKGFLSTVHAYTADQRVHDAPHRDLRRARAAAMSIIPTSTGAASAVGKVLPHLQGKLDGIALRVPVPDGSLVDFTAILKSNVSKEEVNNALKHAAENQMQGIMEYSNSPLVSVDIIGNPHSCIIDSQLTSVDGNLLKLVGWYDNEYGYSCRVAELVQLMTSF